MSTDASRDYVALQRLAALENRVAKTESYLSAMTADLQTVVSNLEQWSIQMSGAIDKVEAFVGEEVSAERIDESLKTLVEMQHSQIEDLIDFAEIAILMLGDACDAVAMCRESVEKITPVLDMRREARGE